MPRPSVMPELLMQFSPLNAVLSVVAKTLQPEQAKDLQEILETLQMLGVSALGMAKGDDKKVYARLAQYA